jgi:hypothetical protein
MGETVRVTNGTSDPVVQTLQSSKVYTRNSHFGPSTPSIGRPWPSLLCDRFLAIPHGKPVRALPRSLTPGIAALAADFSDTTPIPPLWPPTFAAASASVTPLAPTAP